MTTGTELPLFDRDLLTPRYLADPYPYYHALRDHEAVHWSSRLEAWVLTRYEDVHAALRDPRLISGRRVEAYAQALPQEARTSLQPLYDQIGKWIGNMDPPDHTRLRRLVGVVFTPRMIEGLRSRITAQTHALLDAAEAKNRFDFIADFAYPLPAIVIAEMLGVPVDDRQRFMAWSDALTTYAGTGKADLRAAQRASACARELTMLLRQLVAHRRTDPRDDLISALAQVEEQGDRLTEQEMLSMCGFLLVAGHETTMSLLGNGILALLRHREQFDRLANDKDLTASAVEECLRFDSPIQHQTRVAAEDFELADRAIKAGQRVMPFLGAANRDPQQFAQPDVLDLGRTPNKHLTFGFGPHYCVGAPLARLEATIAFRAIVGRFPHLHLDLPIQELSWRVHTSNRSPVSLPVRIR